MIIYKKYKPLINLNNSKYNVMAFTGGRGSMKSGTVQRCILLACTQKKREVCFFRETRDSIKDSVKRDLETLIDNEFKNMGFSYTNTEIRHINGSRIFFKGLREVNENAIQNLKGIASSTDFFVIDEAQAVSKPVLKALVKTLRKKGFVLIVIYNRTSDKLPVEDVLFLDYSTMLAPENRYFVEVNYPEIQHLGLLSEAWLFEAELHKKHKPEDYEEEYLNKPRSAALNSVTKYFTNENIQHINYIATLPLYITCDFNVDPMCWILAHKTDDKVFFFDELCVENTNTQQCIDYLIQNYPDHCNTIYIHGDSSGQSRNVCNEYTNYVIMRNALNKHYKHIIEVRLMIKNKNPYITDRINAWNAKILNHLNEGKREIIISPKCKKLLYNVQNLKTKEGTSIIDLPTQNQIRVEPEKKFLGHPFDAASYLVDYYWPVKSVHKPLIKDEEGLISERNFDHLIKKRNNE